MSAEALDRALAADLRGLEAEGRAKPPERVVVGYAPPRDGRGPRYQLRGSEGDFIRMNSNSYLSLSLDPSVVEAAERAARDLGVGPGAVRFIDGTSAYHVALEERIARFVEKPAARIFNAAYAANCGMALTISSPDTYWIGDRLNHNSIIRALRIAGVASDHKGIYDHNDMDSLRACFEAAPPGTRRVVVISDGVFSMRGDVADVPGIVALAEEYRDRFPEGVVTAVDDSHGVGAYGPRGRGTADFTGCQPDIIVGTLGKAFGVNGGFVAGSVTLAEALRQRADTYLYSNPLGVADCAAATRAIDICDSAEGGRRLAHLGRMVTGFRRGIEALGWETIAGPHPIVPVLVRETAATHRLVDHLFGAGVLVVGLAYPVVPRGDETVRFQVNAAHTGADIDEVLAALAGF